jgi:long-chain fatty acid transport protein
MKVRLFNVVLLLAGMVPGLAAASAPGLPMASFTAGGTGLTPFYVLGFELGPWQDYLARELTPEFLAETAPEPRRVSWMNVESVLILPVFAEQLLGSQPAAMQIKLEWQRSHENTLPGFDRKRNSPGFGFERRLLTPGLVHRINDNQVLGVSAVFAYQSYGTTNLGLRSFQQNPPMQFQTPYYSPYQESGYGSGVRLAVQSDLAEGMKLDAGFQSRIDMEEFANFHGVYSQPADLDIPARASLGLALQASSRSWLNLSVERVMYSDISAFPSRYLPDRFLSLLGDSTSPAFSWDDLTVYSVGWSWSNGEDTEWRLDFSSRSQPLPTSRALSSALDGSLADNAMIIGYSKRMGLNSRFNLNAAYAPAEYAFGGSVLGVTSEDLDQNLEVEAFWTWDF